MLVSFLLSVIILFNSRYMYINTQINTHFWHPFDLFYQLHLALSVNWLFEDFQAYLSWKTSHTMT